MSLVELPPRMACPDTGSNDGTQNYRTPYPHRQCPFGQKAEVSGLARHPQEQTSSDCHGMSVWCKYLRPRSRGGGISVDEGGDDQARVDDQRGENFVEKRPTERFDFLGYSFGAHLFEANGNWYLGASPSKKSVRRFKTKIGDLLVPSNIDPRPEVCDKLNRSLRGWSNYFGYGSRNKAYRSVDQYVFERTRRFLARRHKVQGRGNRRFTFDVIHRELGVLCLQRLPRASRRVPCGEAGRKAGCRKSARPV